MVAVVKQNLADICTGGNITPLAPHHILAYSRWTQATCTHTQSVCQSVSISSAAQKDDDIDEQQANEDEGEVDKELLQVPLGLGVHLDLGRPANGRLGHVLDPLHG